MAEIETFDVVIVGSGPCGISTALHLQRVAPEVAARTLVIEKEFHPRHKLCGGGLTWHGQRMLRKLNLELTVPTVDVHDVRFRYEGIEFAFRAPNVVRIVRRNLFDASLVAQARARGVQVREGCALMGFEVTNSDVLLTTSQGQIRAQAVVGADGAKSFVRRKMGLESPSRVSRLMEVLTPEDPATTAEFRDHMAVFDFTNVPDGVQGYIWDFPSVVEGTPNMNRGIFDSRVLPERPKGDLKQNLRTYMAQHNRNLDDYHLMGNPERWFDRHAEFAIPRVFLAGDAAGIEPLLGEGISFALEYGEVAAQELQLAFATRDFSFAGYRQRLTSHSLGKGLAWRTRAARFSYSRSKGFIRTMWPVLGGISSLLALRVRKARATWSAQVRQPANNA